jgi:hypothetical protein
MKGRYRVVVRRTLIQQDHWAVYLVPVSRPEFELMESAVFRSLKEAETAAHSVRNKYLSIAGFRGKPIKVRICFEEQIQVDESKRQLRGEYERVSKDESTLKGFLENHWKATFKEFGKLRISESQLSPNKWLRALVATPSTAAVLGILAYYSGLVISPPDWLVRILPTGVRSVSQLVIAVSFVAAFSAIKSVFSRRRFGYEMNTLRNYLLALILKHGWHFNQILDPVNRELGKIENAVVSHFADRVLEWDPMSTRNVMRPIEELDDAEVEDWRSVYGELMATEFERRVHALLYLEKEHWYRPNRIRFDPYTFVLAYETRNLNFEVIREVMSRGGTNSDFTNTYCQQSAFRAVMRGLGALIGALALYCPIGFALYLGEHESQSLSMSWRLSISTCAIIGLALPLYDLFRVYVSGDGLPTGFRQWEIR